MYLRHCIVKVRKAYAVFFPRGVRLIVCRISVTEPERCAQLERTARKSVAVKLKRRSDVRRQTGRLHKGVKLGGIERRKVFRVVRAALFLIEISPLKMNAEEACAAAVALHRPHKLRRAAKLGDRR